MQRLYYASGSIITGDAIAAAIVMYAEALAKSPLADSVQIPVVHDITGESGTATLLIGPASQLMTVTEHMLPYPEPEDSQLVDELQRRALLIGSPRPVPQDANEPVLVHEDYE